MADKSQKLTIAQIRAIESRQLSIVNRRAEAMGFGPYTAEEQKQFTQQEEEIRKAIDGFIASLSVEDFPILDIVKVGLSNIYLISKETGQNIRYAISKPGVTEVVNKLNRDFQEMVDRLYLEGLSDQVKEDYKHLLEL